MVLQIICSQIMVKDLAMVQLRKLIQNFVNYYSCCLYCYYLYYYYFNYLIKRCYILIFFKNEKIILFYCECKGV